MSCHTIYISCTLNQTSKVFQFPKSVPPCPEFWPWAPFRAVVGYFFVFCWGLITQPKYEFLFKDFRQLGMQLKLCISTVESTCLHFWGNPKQFPSYIYSYVVLSSLFFPFRCTLCDSHSAYLLCVFCLYPFSTLSISLSFFLYLLFSLSLSLSLSRQQSLLHVVIPSPPCFSHNWLSDFIL